MGIRDKPIVLGSPWQNLLCRAADRNNPRECVDHAIALGEQHLHVLKSYAGRRGGIQIKNLGRYGMSGPDAPIGWRGLAERGSV